MKTILIEMLLFYKRYLSRGMFPRCKYTPTCSSYAIIAIARHGTVKGLLLTAWRLLRCNPFSRGGYDPVPYRLKGDMKWVL